MHAAPWVRPTAISMRCALMRFSRIRFAFAVCAVLSAAVMFRLSAHSRRYLYTHRLVSNSMMARLHTCVVGHKVPDTDAICGAIVRCVPLTAAWCIKCLNCLAHGSLVHHNCNVLTMSTQHLIAKATSTRKQRSCFQM